MIQLGKGGHTSRYDSGRKALRPQSVQGPVPADDRPFLLQCTAEIHLIAKPPLQLDSDQVAFSLTTRVLLRVLVAVGLGYLHVSFFTGLDRFGSRRLGT